MTVTALGRVYRFLVITRVRWRRGTSGETRLVLTQPSWKRAGWFLKLPAMGRCLRYRSQETRYIKHNHNDITEIIMIQNMVAKLQKDKKYSRNICHFYFVQLSYPSQHRYVKTRRGRAIHIRVRRILSTLKPSTIIQLQVPVSMSRRHYPRTHRHFSVSRPYLLFIIVWNRHIRIYTYS